MSQIITHCVAFLFGTITGATGAYFADKYTDQRRQKEKSSIESEQFCKIQGQMPELIKEMKADLGNPENKFVREFFLTSKKWMLNAGGKCFVYYHEDHADLQGKIHVLENMGYVLDITPHNAPKYRMTEEFVSLVLDSN